jgi:hypothetical protein
MRKSPLPNSVFPKFSLIFLKIHVATYLVGKQGPWASRSYKLLKESPEITTPGPSLEISEVNHPKKFSKFNNKTQ